MSKDLAKIIASRFIQRSDTKAIQFSNGKWSPDTEAKFGNHGLGFDMASLLRHLNGEATYGHYLLDDNSDAKVVVFDVDLEKTGSYCVMPTDPRLTNEEFDKKVEIFNNVNPRELWLDRTRAAANARIWYKAQMMRMAHMITKVVTEELQIPAAAAYSGGKGIHVYGFTGKMPAVEVRAAGLLVMDLLSDFTPTRGTNFYQHQNVEPVRGLSNFKIEVFPKQDNLDGKSLGNLVRLPLGKNQKSNDPTFFLDLKAPMATMRPHPNPLELLTSGNPYV